MEVPKYCGAPSGCFLEQGTSCTCLGALAVATLVATMLALGVFIGPLHWLLAVLGVIAVVGLLVLLAIVLRLVLEPLFVRFGRRFAVANLVYASQSQSTTSRHLQSAIDDKVIATALLLDPESVFRRSRQRIDETYRLTVGISAGLAIVLVGGLAGVIVSVLAGTLPLAVVSGSTSALSLLGGLVYKPLDKISWVVGYTQALELLHEKCRVRLSQCQGLKTVKAQIECTDKVWEAAPVLSGASPQAAAAPP
jgi:hypothetical protein